VHPAGHGAASGELHAGSNDRISNGLEIGRNRDALAPLEISDCGDGDFGSLGQIALRPAQKRASGAYLAGRNVSLLVSVMIGCHIKNMMPRATISRPIPLARTWRAPFRSCRCQSIWLNGSFGSDRRKSGLGRPNDGCRATSPLALV
jgi:hypothetical protein